MNYELPYNKTYAVISSGKTHDYYTIYTNIRNPSKTEFRDNYEVRTRNYISDGHDEYYGGTLEVEGHSLDLNTLKLATKTLEKTHKKLDKIAKEYGHTKSFVDQTIRILKSSGCDDIRISDPDEYFSGWDKVAPLSLKKDIDVIRHLLYKIERNGKSLFVKNS